MATREIPLTSGPSRKDLLRAASDENIHAVFGTPIGLIEVQISGVEEIGNGPDFALRGRLQSSSLRGAVVTGSYNSAAQIGRLAFKAVNEGGA